MPIVAIDPGNIQSAVAVIRVDDLRPVFAAKMPNKDLAWMLKHDTRLTADKYVIERVACYGMTVGREIFDTCEWIGRFSQIIKDYRMVDAEYIFRMDEKIAICHNARAKDSNIRRALIDMLATHDLKNGKGTKNNPDIFYGFADDMWAAYAVGFTYIRNGMKGSGKNG